MKTYIYHPLILLVIILVTVSCENELPFNIKDNPPKLVMNDLYNLFFITIQMFIPFLISVALPPLQENDLKSTYYTLYHHQWCDKKVFLFLESQK